MARLQGDKIAESSLLSSQSPSKISHTIKNSILSQVYKASQHIIMLLPAAVNHFLTMHVCKQLISVQTTKHQGCHFDQRTTLQKCCTVLVEVFTLKVHQVFSADFSAGKLTNVGAIFCSMALKLMNMQHSAMF